MEVTSVTYRRHEKEGSPPSLRVDYHCGLAIHREWVCFEHQGYARLKAEGWWQRRSSSFPLVPRTVEEALSGVGALPRPSHIFIRSKGRFTEVAQYRFEACTPSTPASARSVTASPATMAGSTRHTALATPGAAQAASSSAVASARTSVTGGKA